MILKQPISQNATGRGRTAWQMFLGAAVATFLFLTGCDSSRGLQITAEANEPHYQRGIQMARSGQNQVALEAFLKVIEKRGGDAPESHLEAGQICLNHIKDPIAAIYHFRKYLELRSNSQQAPQVRQMIETAIKEFARTLPAQPMEAQVERLDLLDMLEKMKAENATLRAEITRLGRTPPAPGTIVQAQLQRTQPPANDWTETDVAEAGPVQPVVPIEQTRQQTRVQPQRTDPQTRVAPQGGARSHVVREKETLYNISVQVYGSGGRWPAILEANRDQLRSERDLKPGMVLRIP